MRYFFLHPVTMLHTMDVMLIIVRIPIEVNTRIVSASVDSYDAILFLINSCMKMLVISRSTSEPTSVNLIILFSYLCLSLIR